ncbi:hypothetical protein A2W45_01920 [Candidatus Curtissbacteria bacterium RIFCSPHIGHO2_12_41_11]|uniref:Uncharacterized protein n=3 Tax=Candidatus Curtissiibacteriota TaxID=1752717 RepID=A0A1F5HTE9_9BACT|nr:MAG: hypothetical protein UU56_C0008G0064 [Candidatus Curtissbacteria bacterium GW2011_GWA2_41_24]OGD98183.1 MAG: hypothetical protein A2W45_01920 [Candidatus Curtissbacteria bacterium RIFCSPHIGHO2_12_41_11]OGE07383.1 MAG: hypothetical protein A2W70_03260 [Candidatus Curtissbacteria bacterium RIFCSPLOWO2_02_41_11]
MTLEGTPSYVHLVRKTFFELDPEFGRLMERLGEVEGAGFIPLEIPLELLRDRAAEMGLIFDELMALSNENIGIFILTTPGTDEDPEFLSSLVYEMVNCLWVANYDFGNFRKMLTGG